MSTSLAPRRKVSRPLTALEDAFVSFYLGDRGRTQAQAALSYQHAQHSLGLPMSGTNAASSSAYKLLHSERIARIIGRAMAHRTLTAEEITGRLSEIISTPRHAWEKGVLDAGNVVKAAEVLGRFKRMGGDPLEALIIKQVKRMAAREMPQEVQHLLKEGDPDPGVVPIPRPLQASPSMQARTKRRPAPRRRRSSSIEVEAKLIPSDAAPPQVASAGHDAVQHEAMTQCVTLPGDLAPLDAATSSALPSRGSAPRPPHPRPPRR